MSKYWLIFAAIVALYVSCSKDDDNPLSDGTITTGGTNPNETTPFTVDFTTINLSGYKYAPSHVLAVWIEDTDHKFVNSIAVYAQKRKVYLYNWNSTSGGYTGVDAYTGATLKSHQPRSFGWNMQNYKGTLIANGDYYLCVEMTSKNGQGPVLKAPFSFIGEDILLSPNNTSYFKDMLIVVDTSLIY